MTEVAVQAETHPPPHFESNRRPGAGRCAWRRGPLCAVDTWRAARLQPLVGLIVILSLAYAISTNRRAIDRRTVAWGLGLQILFALIVPRRRWDSAPSRCWAPR